MSNNIQESKLALAKQQMIKRDLRGRGISDERVLQALAAVPRERFVPAHYRPEAYADRPLPIGSNQTISQPYIVALMTERLHLTDQCRVLEIGTGSGYQTAILAHLCKQVYTVERHAMLSETARVVLEGLGLTNVSYHLGDGSLGWPQGDMFDGIIITAAIPSFPETLLKQLGLDGRLVGPVGGPDVQHLQVLHKTKTGLLTTDVCAVRFVRLIGEHGFSG
jgi:protein-L-isoaspartate(D-aspartate) O-methyltransferase